VDGKRVLKTNELHKQSSSGWKRSRAVAVNARPGGKQKKKKRKWAGSIGVQKIDHTGEDGRGKFNDRMAGL